MNDAKIVSTETILMIPSILPGIKHQTDDILSIIITSYIKIQKYLMENIQIISLIIFMISGVIISYLT